MAVTPESVLADLAGPPQAWPRGWEDWPEVVEAHRRLFAGYAHQAHFVEPFGSPSLFGEGRGIVMPAGGATYFTCAYVAISVLRATGCKLPVEVWRIGPCEIDPQMEALLRDLGGVEFRDVYDEKPAPRMMSGWGLKPFSVLRSRFREVLLLDADQVLARDPTGLFDDPAFLEKGAVLWGDLHNGPGLDCTAEFFHVMGLPCPDYDHLPGHERPSSYRPVESGQLLIDRSRRLPEVWLASKLCEHFDFLWPRGRPFKCYGDKSTWMAAFLMLATARGEHWSWLAPPYVMPSIGAKFIGDNKGGAGGFIQHDLNCEVLTLHRCQPDKRKWKNRDRLGVPNEDVALESLAKLDKAWSGKPWSFGHGDKSGGDWLLMRPGQEPRRVTLEPGGGGAVAWARDVDTLAITDAQGTVFLTLDPDGNWQHQGLMILHPAPPSWWTVRTPFDAVIWESICGPKNEYRLPDKFAADDVILDIGAHAGAFAIACLDRGAGHVCCVEPNPANLVELRRHLARYPGRATILPVAAWRSDRMAGPLALWNPEGTDYAGGMVRPEALATCWGVPFDSLIDFINERLRLVKIDCESSEYPILFTSQRLSGINEIIGEWHSPANLSSDALLDGVEYSPANLLDLLRISGFAVETVDHGQGGTGNFFAERMV